MATLPPIGTDLKKNAFSLFLGAVAVLSLQTPYARGLSFLRSPRWETAGVVSTLFLQIQVSKILIDTSCNALEISGGKRRILRLITFLSLAGIAFCCRFLYLPVPLPFMQVRIPMKTYTWVGLGLALPCLYDADSSPNKHLGGWSDPLYSLLLSVVSVYFAGLSVPVPAVPLPAVPLPAEPRAYVDVSGDPFLLLRKPSIRFLLYKIAHAIFFFWRCAGRH